MSSQPSTKSYTIFENSDGSADYLQLRQPNNGTIGWIDPNGILSGSLASIGFITPPSVALKNANSNSINGTISAADIGSFTIQTAVFANNSVTYGYTPTAGPIPVVGGVAKITGMIDSGNNVSGLVLFVGTNTFTIYNPTGVTKAGNSGSGLSCGKTIYTCPAGRRAIVPTGVGVFSQTTIAAASLGVAWMSSGALVWAGAVATSSTTSNTSITTAFTGSTNTVASFIVLEPGESIMFGCTTAGAFRGLIVEFDIASSGPRTVKMLFTDTAVHTLYTATSKAIIVGAGESISLAAPFITQNLSGSAEQFNVFIVPTGGTASTSTQVSLNTGTGTNSISIPATAGGIIGALALNPGDSIQVNFTGTVANTILGMVINILEGT